MTDQATKLTLVNNTRSIALLFEKTATDDQWNEMKDSIDTYALHKKLQGRTITHFMGYYTAGGGIFRIRNPNTQEVKALECLPMIKGQHLQKLRRPVTIAADDVLEVFTTVAGS